MFWHRWERCSPSGGQCAAGVLSDPVAEHLDLYLRLLDATEQARARDQ